MGSLHDDIIQFLRQQKETFGSTTHVEIPSNVAPADFNEEALIDESVEQEVLVVDQNGNDDAWKLAESVEGLNELICDCLKCPLGATRTSFVFGSGNPNADLMIVGEAPGAEEDKQGIPFVGRAGKLLTKILEAIELPRDDVFVANILKCRPPNNRKPLTIETNSCEPYLWKQIELVKPKYILALGLTAANTLLRTKSSMKDLRGHMHDYQGIPTMVTYHPAALLRNPNWKKDTWEDVQKLAELLKKN